MWSNNLSSLPTIGFYSLVLLLTSCGGGGSSEETNTSGATTSVYDGTYNLTVTSTTPLDKNGNTCGDASGNMEIVNGQLSGSVNTTLGDTLYIDGNVQQNNVISGGFAVSGSNAATFSGTVANSSASGTWSDKFDCSGDWSGDITVPLSSALTYNFENGNIPAAFVLTGDGNWMIDGSDGGNGSSNSLVSGVITDSQSSCFSVTVDNSSSVSFDYKVSSRLYDGLFFYINSILYGGWSGDTSWINTSYSTTVGTREYKWCYIKDAANLDDSNIDRAWVDNISID